MIRVGFLLGFPVEYKGGINYIKNLLYAIHKFHSKEIEIYLFVPSDLEEEYITLFKDYAKIIHTKIIQRKTFPWLISKVSQKFFNFDPLTYRLLKKYKINVISHSNYVFPGDSIKTINWIPDFQYLHYPKLWTHKQLKLEHRLHKEWILKSDRIVVSSFDALKDLVSVYPKDESKVSVLHFVSQPDILKYDEPIDISQYVKGKYFYLPNQFWEHKNHLIVFKAVKELKKKGLDVKVLTSGLMNDFRSKNQHVEMLRKYVEDHQLTENVSFLGLIPYKDVLQLIKEAVAVINPSFFEGWSSTVEESKSIGKSIILSNINVHQEQDPSNAFYFDPTDKIELASIMEDLWLNADQMNLQNRKEQLLINLDNRTRAFADDYKAIIDQLLPS
ncbi:glycosyltransferase [Pedobacter panaciterrae]|uniref:Glycosyltransferase n=1 Tax=Pedobacter panaciterrae TaxID=363849 RepID=A0ABU8NTP3_9SPHI